MIRLRKRPISANCSSKNSERLKHAREANVQNISITDMLYLSPTFITKETLFKLYTNENKRALRKEVKIDAIVKKKIKYK